MILLNIIRKKINLPIFILLLSICFMGCSSKGTFFSEFLPERINDAGDFFNAWITLSFILIFWNLWGFIVGIIATIVLFVICIVNYGFGIALLLCIGGNVMGLLISFFLKFIFFPINKK